MKNIINKRPTPYEMDAAICEIGAVINRPVRFYNTEGYLICSSVQEGNVGFLCEEAREIANRKEPLAFKIENPGTAHEQTRFSLFHNQDILGVVEIAGRMDDHELLCAAIHRLLEKILFPWSVPNHIAKAPTAPIQFIKTWLWGDETLDESAFWRQGIQYRIDITEPRCVMIMVADSSDIHDQNSYDALVDHAKDQIRGTMQMMRGCLMVEDGNKIVCLIAEQKELSLEDAARLLLQRAVETGHLRFFGGMDETLSAGLNIREHVRKAEKALNANIIRRDFASAPYTYSTLYWDLFTSEVSESAKSDVINRLFPTHSDEEIDNILSFIHTLYENNLSTNQMAEQLHIHPNTLRYRLNKITSTIGLDPVSCEGVARYLTGYHFWQTLHPKNNNSALETSQANPFF